MPLTPIKDFGTATRYRVKVLTKMKSIKGLTLIELLVTIAVLAIVAAIAVPVITNVVSAADQRALAQTQADIDGFVDKYNTSGAYTYDPSTQTFSGYLDLDGNGAATTDEKIEELAIKSSNIVVNGDSAPTVAAEIDFDSTPSTTFAVADYEGSISPETQAISGEAGSAISATTVSVEGYASPYTFSTSSGSLPAGLILNTNTGVVTGTPTEVVSDRVVTILLTDANGLTDTQTHTYNISLAPSVSPAAIAITGESGTPITPTTVNVDGFAEPYSWTVASGALPAGLTLNSSTGVVSGTPTEAVTTEVEITLTDANERVGSQSQSYDISPPPSVALYDSGTTDTSLVGSWVSGYTTNGASGSQQGSYLYLTAPDRNGSDFTWRSNNKIDLTDYSTIVLTMYATNSSYGYRLGAEASDPNLRTRLSDHVASGARQTSEQQIELDVSSVTGNHYILVGIEGAANASWNNYVAGGNMYVTSIVLEP